MEENKEKSVATKRKKAKIAVISLCTILVLLLALQVYAATHGYGNVFFMIRDLVTSKNASGEEEIFIEGKDENTEIKELNIDSKEITELYEYIPALNVNKIQPSAYQNSKVTKNTLEDEYLLAYAFVNLGIPEEQKENFETEYDTLTPDSGWYSFDAKLLEQKVKEMYGTSIANTHFDIGYGQECSYNNGRYLYSAGGGSDEYMTNIRKIEKAYGNSDIIYIEDKYIALKEKGDSSALYATSSSQVEIVRLGTEDLSEKEIKSKYNDKMTSYKHTFKKNENGSYYWYSTEPIESKNGNSGIDVNSKNSSTTNSTSKNITKQDVVGTYTAVSAKDSKMNNVSVSTLFGMHNINLFIYENGIATIDTKMEKDENLEPQPMEATYTVKNDTITLTFRDSSVEELKYNSDGLLEYKYENYTVYFEKDDNFQYEGDNYAEEVMADEAYEKIIEDYRKTSKDFKYTKTDIDNDGTYELLIAQGDSEAEKIITFYTYKGGQVVKLGELGFGHRMLYEMNNEDYLLEVYGHMGMEEVSKVYIKNSKIQKDLISTREIQAEESYKEGDRALEELIY